VGMLARLSSVSAPRPRAMTGGRGPLDSFWYTPEGLMIAGDSYVGPEVALTLSHVYCAVDTISADFGTMTCQTFRNMGDDGRERVKYGDPGIGELARKLRWQPNRIQTAKAFWSTMAWQYCLRPACYAEIEYRPGSNGFVENLWPRHPDRVTQETLPSGHLRYRLREADGSTRYVTEEEMFVVRNTSTDGLNAVGRMTYGAKAITSGLALQDFTTNYYKKGATASLIAAYKGEMDEEEERQLHSSITRYVSGVENAGGLLVVSADDLDVKSLGVDPEKAQLLGLKNLSGRDIARLYKMPPSWLGIEGALAYGSQVQDAANYVNRCQMPIVVEFEQAIQRDLIVAPDRYFTKFNLDYLLRADLKSRMEAYEIGIRSRVLWPSEARVREDLSPDDTLDQLSEGDYRPGASGAARPSGASGASAAGGHRALQKGLQMLNDAAARCVRRERLAVEKLAKKHANDPNGWKDGLKDFYADHAGFVAQTMRVSVDTARTYGAQHGSVFEAQGILPIAGDNGDHWERTEADELAALALGDDVSVAA
jgi:HK97 family phage portal protein